VKKINTDNLLVLEDKQFETHFLGRILWFTISDCKVSYEQLKEAFQTAGIDEKYLPKEISPRDAFRRATKVAEAKRIKLDDDTYLNLLVREVKMADDEIVRQLVREVVDSKNTRLEYLPVVEFALKNDTDFSADPMIGKLALYREEQSAMDNVTLEFEKCRQNYNGRHVRELVQSILSGCDPVAVRPSGGVYFVPEKYGNTVQSLSDMVRIISQYSINAERSRLYSVPVIDAKEHRVMVAESLEDQVKNNSQSLVSEMANVLKSGRNITQKTAEQYISKVKDLKKMVASYSEMLNTEILNVDEIMNIAMQQARKLLDNVEAA
jgi:DNA-binding protein H-NS